MAEPETAAPPAPLHPRQERILAFVRSFTAEHGYAPSYREIAAGAGLSTTSLVGYHLNQLRAAGLADMPDGPTARGVRTVGQRMVTPGDMVTVRIGRRVVEAELVA